MKKYLIFLFGFFGLPVLVLSPVLVLAKDNGQNGNGHAFSFPGISSISSNFQARFSALQNQFENKMQKTFDKFSQKTEKVAAKIDKKSSKTTGSNWNYGSTTANRNSDNDNDRGDNHGTPKPIQPYNGPCIFVVPGNASSTAWYNTHNYRLMGLPLCQQTNPTVYQQLTQFLGNNPPPVVTPQPPIISNIVATPTSSTTATISWNTDASSSSNVSFATSTPIAGATSLQTVGSNSLVTFHQIFLTNLATSTTYYFDVFSTDSGGTATSVTMSFTTPAPIVPVLLAPVISNLIVNNLSSTTATINWQTDEFSSSRVFFATSTPVMSAPNLNSLFSSTLTASHIMPLSTLQASTTYFFLVSSTNSLAQTSTSSESSFMTQ